MVHGGHICSPPCLLVSNTTDIITIHYQTSAVHSVVSGLTRAVAIDVHFSQGYMFWSDVTELNIKRSRIDGSSVTVIISNIGVCDGLAVEWRTSQLYWSDTTHDSISVSDLSGNNQRSVISAGLDEPRDVAVDPDSGLMFWTDWGLNPKIEKATLNGNQRVSIVTSDLYWPNGIDLDRGNQKIFWADAGVDRVESVDYDGGNRRLLFQQSGLHPFGVALIPPFLYFTDWATHRGLHKLDAHTGDFIINDYTVSGQAMGIVAYDSSRQSSASSSCNVNNGGCSHFCVTESSGHKCVCPAGLSLNSDERTCEEEVKKFMLVTDADAKLTSIISLDVEYFIAKSLWSHNGMQRPVALDFDPSEKRVYWSDVAQGLILSAFMNATSVKILVRCNVKTPDGLAVDVVGRNIYWTDTETKRIEVASLDGSRRKILVKEALDKPRAIVLDERNGMMYWTDWGSDPKIEKAAMDGSSRQSIVNGNLSWPNGLTIDKTTNLLYWADAKLDKIEVSDLNGGNRRLILSSSADVHPFGLTLYQGMLYWTDWNTKSISRFNLSNGDQETMITGLHQPMDIHLFDGSATDSDFHPCARNMGNCSDLCLLMPQRRHQCACPTGVTLKSDGRTCDYDNFNTKSSDKFMLFAEGDSGEIYKVPLAVSDTPCQLLGIQANISRPVAVDYDPVEEKVYWTDVTLKLVARAFPNGSDVEVIAQHNVSNPDGIAVDWLGRNLYWTDVGTKKIEVSKLDGSIRKSLITTSIDSPRAILLDIAQRKMYWSDWGSSAKIEQANMDATARTTLVRSGLVWVNSLALDYEKRLLYWCDAQLDKIERIDLQGNNRMLILDFSDGGVHPFGLAIYEDVLFWTDWITKSVQKHNLTSSLSGVFVHGLLSPMEVHIYNHKEIVSGPTTCSQLNGGCSHLCLPSPNGHQCFCPEGISLKPGDPLTCEGVTRCPQLSAPKNGMLDPCSNLPGQICRFSCTTGYVLGGASIRKCNNDGSWTGEQTNCTVVTCPALQSPPNGERLGCTGTVTEIYNTICRFSCHSGYKIFGSTTRTCRESGSWSGQEFHCEAINCSQLVTPPRAVLLTVPCTRTYGSSCSFSCQSGFASSIGNVTRTCMASGQWSGNDIICTDVQSPTFGDSCPGSPLLEYAERKEFSALVNWTEPVATDNSGVTPTVTSNHHSPKRFNEGSHLIIYTAVDLSGNSVTCSFTINVAVINCTSLRVDPGGPLRMSSCGNNYGAHCNFSCATGYRINGSLTLMCIAPGEKPPGFWNNAMPRCEVIRCPSLPTPTNGTKHGCVGGSSERYGTVCGFSCDLGFSFRGSSSRRCLENGSWSGSIAYCQEIRCSALVLPINGAVSPASCLLGAVYGQTCGFTCPNTGYVQQGTSARVCGSDGEWTGANDTICRDNTAPSFNNTCPENMVFTVPECSSSALVSWTEPFATDNSNHVVISYPSLRPPVNLSIGVYYFHYSAADGEGNRVNCTFIVQIARQSCLVLTPPLHGTITSLSCGSSFGSQANMSCNRGYQLAGSRVRSCQENGRWSGNTTRCIIVKCPPIETPILGTVVPEQCKIISGVVYKTECLFMCNDTNGYQLQGPEKVACLGNGSWSADSKLTICQDIQRPNLRCPPDMEVPTITGQSYANVSWQVPVPTDNSNEPLNLTGLSPPLQLNVGRTEIKYEVIDSAGLKTGCAFSIHVKDLEAPRIESCPDDIRIISGERWNTIILPAVNVTDNVGVNLFSTNIVNGSQLTWGKYNVNYTANDLAGNTATCKFLIEVADSPCEDFPAPKNGAKACETWLAGLICTVHCNKGYGFANTPETVYICSPNGEWFNAKVPGSTVPAFPDCSKTHQAQLAWNGEFHYLTDECGGEEMDAVIANNFIELLRRSPFGMAGACNEDCKIENVQVECGEKTRRKRDAADNKRTATIPLTVSFVLKVPLPSNSSQSDLNATSLQILNNIQAALNESDMTLNISGMFIETDPSKPPKLRFFRLVCDQGQLQRGTTCVNCPPGYYFNATSCEACALDRYQDQEAQTSCLSCPSGTSTFGQQASKQRQDCQVQPTIKLSTSKEGLPKMIIILVLAGGAILLVVLLIIGLYCGQKYCCGKNGKVRNHPVGYENETYAVSDWYELHQGSRLSTEA